MRERVASSIAAIVPWKVAPVGLGGVAVSDTGGLGEFGGGEPEATEVMVSAELGAPAGPDEQAPARKDAARQNAMMMAQGRLRLTAASLGRSGNSVVAPG